MLYFAKLFCFERQLQKDQELNPALERMARFLALLYVPAWLKAPVASDAPHNDAMLWNQLQEYRQVDDSVARAALAVLKRHPWYFAPETVVFSLCSSQVSDDIKAEMALRLVGAERPTNFEVGANAPVILDDDSPISLVSLVDEDSWFVFHVLDMKGEWLKERPETWSERAEYAALCEYISGLKVTNDTAERGVQIIQHFARTVTKDEADLQWLLQCVEDHRKKYPDFRKSTMSGL